MSEIEINDIQDWVSRYINYIPTMEHDLCKHAKPLFDELASLREKITRLEGKTGYCLLCEKANKEIAELKINLEQTKAAHKAQMEHSHDLAHKVASLEKSLAAYRNWIIKWNVAYHLGIKCQDNIPDCEYCEALIGDGGKNG